MRSREEDKFGVVRDVLVYVVGILREGVAGLTVTSAVSRRGADNQHIYCSSSFQVEV